MIRGSGEWQLSVYQLSVHWQSPTHSSYSPQSRMKVNFNYNFITIVLFQSIWKNGFESRLFYFFISLFVNFEVHIKICSENEVYN